MTRRTRPRWPAVVALACAAAWASSACSGTATGQRPAPWWAGAQKPGATQATAFGRVPGSPSYQCVRVGHHRDVRSGGFVAGNFKFDEQLLAAANPYQMSWRHAVVKIYWIPLRVGHMPTLTVHAALLPGRAVTRSIRQTQVATSDHVVFYPSGIPIPAPGTWEILATAGPNKGCFIVTFTEPGR